MKSPAFQVYVNDFLGSAKVGMMSTEEIGAYWLLLFLEWQETGFVYNEQQLARWCRMTPARFRKAWTILSTCFVEIDGRLHNPRLQKEREKQEAWREKSAKGGKKSGEARSKGGSHLVQPLPQPNGNTPLPLPLPVTTRTKKKTIPPVAESWTVEGAALWNEQVGHITTPRFGAAVKPMVDRYGWTDTKAAMLTYIELNEGKPRNVEWMAKEHVRWVSLAKMPCVDPNTRELTEKGRMAYNG